MPEEFANLVQRLIKKDSASIKQIAAQMGMKEDTLRSRLRQDEQRINFTLEEARKLIQAFPNIELANYLLAASPFVAVECAPDIEVDNGQILQSTNRVMKETSEALTEVSESLADGKIDHREKLSINKEIDEAVHALLALKLHFERT